MSQKFDPNLICTIADTRKAMITISPSSQLRYSCSTCTCTWKYILHIRLVISSRGSYWISLPEWGCQYNIDQLGCHQQNSVNYLLQTWVNLLTWPCQHFREPGTLSLSTSPRSRSHSTVAGWQERSSELIWSELQQKTCRPPFPHSQSCGQIADAVGSVQNVNESKRFCLDR